MRTVACARLGLSALDGDVYAWPGALLRVYRSTAIDMLWAAWVAHPNRSRQPYPSRRQTCRLFVAEPRSRQYLPGPEIQRHAQSRA